jgi:hypothetical protein
VRCVELCEFPDIDVHNGGHACDICKSRMHALCGYAVCDAEGEEMEGFGAPRRCSRCQLRNPGAAIATRVGRPAVDSPAIIEDRGGRVLVLPSPPRQSRLRPFHQCRDGGECRCGPGRAVATEVGARAVKTD